MTQTYSYDAVNRLQTAKEEQTVGGATIWQQQYGYDRFGNRWYIPGNYLPDPTLTPQSASDYEATTNHLVRGNSAYADGAGNLTHDAGSGVFTYDAENRQATSNANGQVANYFYDGEGRRIKKVVTGTPTVTTVFVYNTMGQLIADYSDSTPPPVGGTKYATTDHLGSTRVVTGTSATAILARYDYLPYGEELPANVGPRTQAMGYSNGDKTWQKFTAKERDTESGLDYFGARYYSSAQGRFTSADTFGGSAVNPQTLNLYSYVQNNPLNFTDPTGHYSEPSSHSTPQDLMKWTKSFNEWLKKHDPHPHGFPGFRQDPQQDVERNVTLAGLAGRIFTWINSKKPNAKTARFYANEWANEHPNSGFDPGQYSDEQILKLYNNGSFSKTAGDIFDPLQILGIVTVGMGGRILTPTEEAEFDAFAQRARSTGLVENKNRTGSWGRYGANGTFEEVARIDVGEAGKPGFRGQTHTHIDGVGDHLNPATKLPGEP